MELHRKLHLDDFGKQIMARTMSRLSHAIDRVGESVHRLNHWVQTLPEPPRSTQEKKELDRQISLMEAEGNVITPDTDAHESSEPPKTPTYQ